MTTMNNEDPADPGVHEQRELPEPAAWRVRGYAQFKTGKPGPWRFVDSAMLPTVQTPEDCDFDALYTADQMREAIAAERERHAQAMRDAARYRFVRTADKVAISAEAARDPVAYDAAIDAAIAAEKEQPK